MILVPDETSEFSSPLTIKYGAATFTTTATIGRGVMAKSADDLWTVSCTHSSTSQKHDATTHWTECSECGNKENIEKHTFNESQVEGGTLYTCSKCGFTKTSKNKENGFLYADVEGGVEIISYDGSDVNVVVPSTLGGKTVVGLGEYAFAKLSNRTTIKSVTLPTTIKTIGYGAFNGCTALMSVNLPSGLKRIEGETFSNCSSLGSITIPYGVNFIGESAFGYSGIASVVIPCSVNTIKSNAFEKCTNLGSVVIPDSVTSIDKATFLGCSALKKAEIGSGVTRIPQSFFDSCTALETVTLPATLNEVIAYAFADTALNTVNFRGTQVQWDAITIYGKASSNKALADAAKNYEYAVKTDVGQHKYAQAGTFAPTCVAEGYTLNMCEGCGDAFKTNITPATGIHDYNSGVITTEPTCTATGVKTYICNDCGDSFTETVPAAHTPGAGTVTAKATPSKAGVITYKCTVCGEVAKTAPIAKIASVTLSKSKYTYDKKAKKPGVTVKDANGKVIPASQYTVSYAKGRKAIGTYAVKVTFKGSNYSGSKSVNFTIAPKGTTLSKLTKGKKSFTATWKKQTNQTSGYEIQYSTSKKFASGNKTVIIKKNKTTKTTVKKLKAKKTYYVRVRTYKTVKGKKIYSDWSKAKSVKTK